MFKYTAFLGIKVPVFGPLLLIFSTYMFFSVIASCARGGEELTHWIDWADPTGPWSEYARRLFEAFDEGYRPFPDPGTGIDPSEDPNNNEPAPLDDTDYGVFILAMGHIRNLLMSIIGASTYMLGENDPHYVLNVANKIHQIIPGVINSLSGYSFPGIDSIFAEIINLATQVQNIFANAEASGININDNHEIILTLNTIIKDLFVKLGTIHQNVLYEGVMASNVNVLRDNVLIEMPDNLIDLNSFLEDFLS